MSDLPPPLTPAGCDLRDFPHTPLFRSRLFGSSFHARATDGEWRAGVTLWLKSWDQVPAGSLPNDDIELCRLAELARDLKLFKKIKDGALRGWTLCADGRLYHPVVAEGVNTALEAKIKQRLKTAKARIGALEKHLKEAKTDAERARITEEIRKVQQTLSLGLSQTQSLDPREGEGKEKEKEKGLNSVPDGTGAKAPMTTDEIIFGYGVPLLVNAGSADKAARSFLGGLRKGHGDQAVVDALRNCLREKPLQPLEWLAAALPPAGAKAKPNAQEALEASNRAVGERFLAEQEAARATH